MTTMTMQTTTPPTTPANPMTEPGTRLERWTAALARRGLLPSSLRARMLAWYIGLLAFATLASVFVAREIVLQRLDERISAELVQEANELRRLAGGRDPETGQPFRGRVRRIFEVFLERNIPSRNEALLTYVEGEPYLRSRRVLPYQLDRDPELTARWANLRQSERGHVDTPAGPVEYLALPLRSGDDVAGVFVVAIFRDREEAAFDAVVLAAGGVGLAVLLIGSLLAWRLAEGVLRPVRSVTSTARAISETDLSRRIPVRGHDEIAHLTATFNDMLDRLEAAFETQRHFVDDAGHELKTPITIIRGHLELLEGDPEERRETIALVMDELDRMGRIVNDLLLLAKSEEPDFLGLETVDVEPLTNELEQKAGALGSRDWRLERRGRGIIVADRQRLTQAIVQLVQNAVEHTSEGDRISLGSAVESGEASFWVRDEGPGIPLDDQERIFQRFGRGAGARRAEGAGLGLAIVKAIADAHHGRVELYSRPGAGALFTVVIPADQPQPESSEEEA
jgi:signal transduction histidine kinase